MLLLTSFHEFNNNFVSSLSEKIFRVKNKAVVLMDDLNLNLLKYENYT